MKLETKGRPRKTLLLPGRPLGSHLQAEPDTAGDREDENDAAERRNRAGDPSVEPQPAVTLAQHSYEERTTPLDLVETCTPPVRTDQRKGAYH